MSRWLAEAEAERAATPPRQRLAHDLEAATVTVSEHARTEGRRALEAGELAEAAAHWRIAAALDNPEVDEMLDRRPAVLDLIELYLKLGRPNLALAWCIIAADDGLPPHHVQPLMTRAWQGVTADPPPGTDESAP